MRVLAVVQFLVVLFWCNGAHANLALNRPVVASSLQTSTYVAANAVDGQGGTRWSSQFADPQWLRVDLGSVYTIDRVVLRWEAAAAKGYEVQVSLDGSTFTPVYSTSTGDGGVDDIALSPVSARYVRMYGTQRTTPYGYSLWEFEIYGVAAAPPQLTTIEVTPASATVAVGASQQYTATGRDQYGAVMTVPVTWTVSGGGNMDATGLFTATTLGGPYTVTASSSGVTGTASVTVTAALATNLALNRPVVASSVQSSAYVAEKAVDGKLGTRWSSQFSDPQWLQVDLGDVYRIQRVVLYWESAARAYQIQWSLNGLDWTDAYSTTSGDGGVDDVALTLVDARYVRIYGTQKLAPTYGYSLWELDVYGLPSGAEQPGPNFGFCATTSEGAVLVAALPTPAQAAGAVSFSLDPLSPRVATALSTNGAMISLNPDTGEFTFDPSSVSQRGTDTFQYRVDSDSGVFLEVATIIVDIAIMPLGDSITQGYIYSGLPLEDERVGYRKSLDNQLADNGYYFDIVGYRDWGSAIGGFDWDNEGHPGFTPCEIAYGESYCGGFPLEPDYPGVYESLKANPADIVLLHIGTNEQNIVDVGAILDEIDAWETDGNNHVHVLLATIIENIYFDVPAFNQAVVDMVNARSGDSIDITFVDMYTALQYPGDLATDGIHPNEGGYAKMAMGFYRDLAAPSSPLKRCP